MFDQILNLVKEHIGGNSEVSSAIPADRQDEVHHEIANHIQEGLKSQASSQGGVGGMLSSLSGGGGGISSAISGGLAGRLASKFGLPASATAAITGAIPGLLQKFAHKANDPNDSSITPDSLGSSLSGNTGGGLSGLFK
jgi:hypothetical protein